MASYGYKTHVVTPGDSLQKIALMYSVEDWNEIAYFNKLVYPFIEDDITVEHSGKVARVGDTIFIPSYDYIVSPVKKEPTLDTMEEQAYGCDFDIYTAIDDNGKVKNLEEKGELAQYNKDIRLIKGIQNLKQQLNIKMSTPKGSLMLHPEFGCDITTMVGSKGSEENLTKMMLMVQEAILEDFRVVSISNLTLEKNGSSVEISCDIQPIAPYPVFTYNETIYGNN